MNMLIALLFTLSPPCSSDDGSGPALCHWSATTQGNGRGHSFLKVGRHYYTQQRTQTHTLPEAPALPLPDGIRGVR